MGSALFYVVMIGLVVFAWPTQWGGKTTYIVVRGTSMEPSFHTGDIVIARATDDHQVGDILVYAVPDGSTGAGKLIMHRLIEIRPDGTVRHPGRQPGHARSVQGRPRERGG